LHRSKYFEGFDLAFTPYIRIQKGKIKQSLLNDIAPENNNSVIIPQIMTKEVDEFVFLAEKLHDLGYEEINWNLGCPYPMVAKRKLGSGMLAYPELLESILEKVIPQIKTKLSIKMRSGYLSDQDYLQVLPVLNQFPLSEIILHPRYAKQLYKGKADASIFEEALKISKHKLAYNGDIDSFETFRKLSARFANTKHFMIGRGLIANPFLIEEIKTSTKKENKKLIFKEFHDNLYFQYEEKLFGSGHLLSKMLHLWEYFSLSFENSHKVYKRIKKAKSISKYNEATNIIFREENIK